MSQELLDACKKGSVYQVHQILHDTHQPVSIHYHDTYGRNALMFACEKGDIDIVKYLLTSPELTEHSNIHTVDDYGWNALMYASSYGHLNIIEYLLDSNNIQASINIYDKDCVGSDIFIKSIYNGFFNIAHYLIMEHHFQVEEKTIDWLTQNNHEEIITMIHACQSYERIKNTTQIKNDSFTYRRKI